MLFRSHELRKSEDYQGAGLIRTWVAGGFWTQEQLYHHGSAINPLCAWCKHEEGTPSHRIHRCLAHASERQDWCGDERRLLAQGRIEHGARHPMTYVTCKGLFPDPAYDPQHGLPPPHPQDRLVWERHPPNGGFSGFVCTDGSGRNARHPLLARAGWAVAMVNGRGHWPPPMVMGNGHCRWSSCATLPFTIHSTQRITFSTDNLQFGAARDMLPAEAGGHVTGHGRGQWPWALAAGHGPWSQAMAHG